MSPWVLIQTKIFNFCPSSNYFLSVERIHARFISSVRSELYEKCANEIGFADPHEKLSINAYYLRDGGSYTGEIDFHVYISTSGFEPDWPSPSFATWIARRKTRTKSPQYLYFVDNELCYSHVFDMQWKEFGTWAVSLLIYRIGTRFMSGAGDDHLSTCTSRFLTTKIHGSAWTDTSTAHSYISLKLTPSVDTEAEIPRSQREAHYRLPVSPWTIRCHSTLRTKIEVRRHERRKGRYLQYMSWSWDLIDGTSIENQGFMLGTQHQEINVATADKSLSIEALRLDCRSTRRAACFAGYKFRAGRKLSRASPVIHGLPQI